MMYRIGEKHHGFISTEIDDLPEYKGEGFRFTHEKTGLDLYHVKNDDKENLFSFIFKTPPYDDTGLPHILEHCVLSGSRKYPIKDPFLAMMNGSMNTFLNAMTYPDKTVFPAASTVERDYFNLMSVYGDAVFFPLLKEEIFMQEGIRFEKDGDGGILPQGVVFNEMKGAYSNHDSIASEYSYRKLFPDTPYRFDSGGEPSAIPSLTYEAFVAFHKRYYHPSNCRIFLYGDIETDKQLAFIEENFLGGFSAKAEPAEELNLQPGWSAPVVETITCPFDEDGEGDDLATITMNWKTAGVGEPINILAFEVLAEALLGNMGAPVYKAVVESGLGEDLSPVSGIETDLREIVFSIGIRGAKAESREDFEKLIMDLLEDMAENGIPADSLTGAIHKVEFRNREIKGGAPFGLRLMGRSLKGWLHDASPSHTMVYESSMEELKRRIADDSSYFSRMLKTWFIDNPNRITLSVVPDAGHNSRMDSDIEAAVEKRRASYTAEEASSQDEKLESFQNFQEQPDDKNADLIPTLDLEDLPLEIRKIKTDQETFSGVPLYSHKLFTNGIVYLDLAIDVRDIEDEDGMLLPFFSRMICSSALPDMTYDEVAVKLSMITGGLYTFLESSRTAGKDPKRKDYLFFRLKALESDFDEAMKLTSDLFLKSLIGDETRIKDLLLEMKNDFKSSIIPAGHSFCAVKAGAEFDRVLEREDEWRGTRQYLYINSLAADLKKSVPQIGKKLLEIRDELFAPGRISFNITCEEASVGMVKEGIVDFLKKIDDRESVRQRKAAGAPLKNEPAFSMASLAVPSSICYTAAAFPCSKLGTEEHSHETLLGHLLKTNYLWEEVRMKNGAYGVYAAVNGTEGLFTLSTYRDPAPGKNINATRTAFDSAISGRYKYKDLKKAIITVVGKDAKPLSPGEQSLIGFRRELYDITDEMRQQKREAMLGTTTEDIMDAAIRLKENMKGSVTVVMGPDSVINELAAEFGDEIKENRQQLPL